MSLIARLSSASILSLLACSGSFGVTTQLEAQSSPDSEALPKAYGSVQYNAVDSINLENGRLDLQIPFLSYPQRGSALKVSYVLHYASLNVVVEDTSHEGECTQSPEGSPSTCPYNFDEFGGMYVTPTFLIDTDNPERIYFERADGLGDMAADGSGHQYQPCNSQNTSAYSMVDNQGIVYASPCNSNLFPQTVTDSNGNQITAILTNEGTYGGQYPQGYYQITGFTDTLGRTLPVASGTGIRGGMTAPGIYGSSSTVGPDGVAVNTVMRTPPAGNSCNQSSTGSCGLGIIATTYADGLSGNSPSAYATPGGQAGYIYPAATLQLQDGSHWSFGYDTDTGSGNHYGDLTKVTNPLGGSISYTWGNFPFEGPCFTNIVGDNWIRTVTSRSIDANDGSGPQTWTYQLTPVNISGFPQTYFAVGSSSNSGATTWNDGTVTYSPGNIYGMLVTDPAGNQTLHVFSAVGGCSYYEIDTEIYQGPVSTRYAHGVPIAHTLTTYASSQGMHRGGGRPFAATFSANEVWPTSVTTDVSSTTHTAYASGPALQVADSNGNALNESSHFNEPTATTILDSVTGKQVIQNISFEWQNSPSFLAAGLLQQPASTSTLSGNNTIASTSYLYDQTSPKGAGALPQLASTPPMGVRGNLTTIQSWLNTTNTSVVTGGMSWYSSGMPYQKLDSYGVPQTTYTYSAQYAGAYPSTVQAGTLTPEQRTWDFNTGVLTGSVDANNEGTSYAYYSQGVNQAGRLQEIGYPDSGKVSFTYPNATTTVAVTAIDSSMSKTQTTVTDGLGRTIQQQTGNAPAPCGGGIIYQIATYDYADRLSTQTRPYCTLQDSTFDVMTYTYDALGRLGSKGYSINDDDRHAQYSYVYPTPSSAEVTLSDGMVYLYNYDASGRLLSVLEPSDTDQQEEAGPTVETDYTYDQLGNLASVNQLGDANHQPQDPVQTRTMTYDSLSRLTNTFNPESGVVTYTYDNNSNLSTVTDARGIQKLFCYDSIGRVLSISVLDTSCPSTGGPSANPYTRLIYDVAVNPGTSQMNLTGRLSAVLSASGRVNDNSTVANRAYSYDAMGRTSIVYEALPSELSRGTYHTTTTSYNLAGGVTSLTYPSGRVLQNKWNTTGALVSVQDATGGVLGTSYLSSATYFPDGNISQLSLGNVIVSTIARDVQSRPVERKVSTTPNGTLRDDSLAYGQGGYEGGELLAGIQDNYQQRYGFSYAYDPLRRLNGFSGVTGTSQFSQTYGYSASGNLIQSQNLGIAASTLTYGSDNKISPNTLGCVAPPQAQYVDSGNPVYDRAGNLLCDGPDQYGSTDGYTFDLPNRMSAVYRGGSEVAAFTYTGDGQRIRKDSPATQTFKEYAWGPQGVLSEHLSTGAWVDYVYGGSSKIAQVTSTGTTYYLTDQVGTTDMAFESDGSLIWQGFYSPFGQELAVPTGATNYKFTGKERDTESGLDYFGARYYGSVMGRFMSPDPSGLYFADPTSPQSLNLYSYARNNPLQGTDPTGMAYCQWDDGSKDDPANTGVADAVNSGTDCTDQGGTWKHDDGLNDDGTPVGSESSPPALTVTATLVTDTDTTSVTTTGDSYDPDDANLYLLSVGITEDTNHAFGCIAGAYGVGAPSAATGTTGSQVFNASQNLVGKAKAAGAAGSTTFTSEAAMAARASSLGSVKLGFNFPTPVGTPFSGNFAMRGSGTLGGVAGRYAPYAGAAMKVAGVVGTAYSSYKLYNCLGH